MSEGGTNTSHCSWQLLEAHFRHHARLVNLFRDANASSITFMWNNGVNKAGERLSQFERDALVERHCELFGTWPQ